MERTLLHHRLYSSSPHPFSSLPVVRALHVSPHSPSAPRLRLAFPSRFPLRPCFRSIFFSSLPFLPFHAPSRCPKHSHLPLACISSSAFPAGAGGGGLGCGGGSGGGGGGHGGGDGFVARQNGAQAVGPESDDILIAGPEEVIFLDVGGMSCGGCASSVKKILESQPYVLYASVNLATETAVVKVSLGLETLHGSTKRDVGDALAEHLSSCGFKSSVREEPVGG